MPPGGSGNNSRGGVARQKNCKGQRGDNDYFSASQAAAERGAVTALARAARTVLLSRYYRRWCLRSATTLRRDQRLCDNASVLGSAQCVSCGELRTMVTRLHHRVAQRDRLVNYYAAQRDATVRWGDRVVHAATIGAAMLDCPTPENDQLLAALSRPTAIGAPPPPPPPHPTLAVHGPPTSEARREERHMISPLVAFLTQPVAVEAELRSRIAALESRLAALGDNPRSVVWPQLPVEDVLHSSHRSTRRVTSASNVPKQAAASVAVAKVTAAAAGKEPSEVDAAPSAFSARRSTSAAYNVHRHRRSMTNEEPTPTSPTMTGASTTTHSTSQPCVAAWTAPAVNGGCGSNAASSPASETIDEEPADDDSTAATITSATTVEQQPPRSSGGQRNWHSQAARGQQTVVTLRYEASAGLATLDDDAQSSSPCNKATAATAAGRGGIDPSGCWPSAPAGSTGRPLRLHRVPAEMFQILQPAPLHQRGFAPSQHVRGGSGVGGGGGQKRSASGVASGSNSNGTVARQAGGGQQQPSGASAYRVVPQRQPTVGTAMTATSAAAAVPQSAAVKKMLSRGS